MKRNLTVQLDESTVRKARVVATKRSISISRLVTEEIEKAANSDISWSASRRIALEQLENPFHLGGEIPSREFLHKR